MGLFWKIFMSFMIAMTRDARRRGLRELPVRGHGVRASQLRRPRSDHRGGRDGARAWRRARAQGVAAQESAARPRHRLARDQRARRRAARTGDAARARPIACDATVSAADSAPEPAAHAAHADPHRAGQRGVSAAVRASARDRPGHPDVARHASRGAQHRDSRRGRDVAAARALSILADRAPAEGEPRARGRRARHARRPAVQRAARTRSARWRATSTRWPSASRRS